MMGPSHRIAGVAAWLGVAPLVGVTDWRVAAGAGVAGAFAHGRLSPDMDIYPLLGTLIPGGHRGITHVWIWPVLVALLAFACRPAGWWFVVLAVAVAWGSHVAADGVFGRVPVWPKRRRGPRGGRWRYAGVGWRTGGVVEQVVALGLLGVVVWLGFGAAVDAVRLIH
jgi:membrane-bound metal-dependent hydrolase YbcI (DUF457 family)